MNVNPGNIAVVFIGDGYQAALVNYRYLAHGVRASDDIVADMVRAGAW